LTLESYLEQVQYKPFSIEDHNCIQFTNHCWKVVYNHYWSEDWLKVRHFDELPQFSTPVEAVSSRLQRQLIVTRHSLVAIKLAQDTYAQGLVFGFCLGKESVFVGETGLRYVPTKIVRYCWK